MMQASRSLASRLLFQSARRYHGGGMKPPSMDELPVPRGSWQAQYDRNQRKYNATLAAGTSFLIFSIVVAKTSGLLYFNWGPPETYE